MGEEPNVSEEPFPGWLRYETPGSKPWFKTPPPRTIIRDMKKLEEFLKKEHSHQRMLHITGEEFSFKRRYGLKRKSAIQCSSEVSLVAPSISGGVSTEVICEEELSQSLQTVTSLSSTDILDRLTRNKEKVDHRKCLSRAAKELDSFRATDGYEDPENIENIRSQLQSSKDLREIFVMHSF